MDQHDKEKTAFSTGNDLWQFNVMPFGLCNSPATFQRLIELVLHGLSWHFCLIYMDDIIVHSKGFEEHVVHLREVFSRLRAANLKLNPMKCTFLQREVSYLGHVVSAEGVRTDPVKIKSVLEWERPHNKTQVRSFIGLCAYYRKFIKDFSTIARPMHKLMEHHTPFVWDEDCDRAFQCLKQKLIEAPVLAYPRDDTDFVLDTDASYCGIGAVLSQVQDGKERVVAYYSKSLSKAERNYCVTRKELVAVNKAVQHFHHHLYGRHFKLRTDHAALTWLRSFKDPEGQVARWIERFSQYDYTSEHRPGIRHGNADGLSRRPCYDLGCKHCTRLERMAIDEAQGDDRLQQPCHRVTAVNDSFRTGQQNDPVLQKVVEWVRNGKRPAFEETSRFDSTTKSYWAMFANLLIKDGVLCRKFVGQHNEFLQRIVPKKMVKDVMEQIPGGLTGGHYGVTKTLIKVKERFYWIGVSRDVKLWCMNCTVCGARKGPATRSRGELKPILVGEPFQMIGIDILGPFPATERANRWILVMTDYFTKWPEAVALPTQTAEVVADALLSTVVQRFGVPQQIHSDQGRNFESEVFGCLMDMLGAKKTRTTPLHPQSDGQTERFNRTLLDYLSKFVDREQKTWDKLLPLALLSYRASTHESTKFSPAMLNLGRELTLPIDLWRSAPPEARHSDPSYVQQMRETMERIYEEARCNLNLTAESMKRRYDYKSNGVTFNEGNLVWLFNPQRRIGKSPKLQCDWEGPYKVLRRISDLIYEIKKDAVGSRKKIVHVDRLAPFRGDSRDD